MGSYQQIIVGGMLLVTAFVFGRYVMNHPPGSKIIADTSETAGQKLQLQADTDPANSNNGSDANVLQQSLRDRILGARAMNSPAAKALTPKPQIEPKKASTSPVTLAEQPIVVPDFSHLELERPVPTRPFDERSQQPPARFSINPKPTADALTHRGVLNIRETEAKLVPVQQKQSQLTLQNREFVEYTTVFGDTLHSLSTKFFGSPEFYLDIYLANRQLLRNPSDVPVNTTIRIPIMRTAEKNTPVG